MNAFTVLAESTRRRILDCLREGERPVNALVAELGISQPTVSKHVRVLRDAGMVSARADAQQRRYRLEPAAWHHVNPSAVVRWELSPVEGGCLLRLTHSLGMEDLRAAAATVALGDDVTTILSRNGAGWHRLLDRLDASLDGRSDDWSEQDQRTLQDRYAAMLR